MFQATRDKEKDLGRYNATIGDETERDEVVLSMSKEDETEKANAT